MALIADAANVSQDGKLNVLGRFRAVYAATLPARHPSMTLVVELEASAFEAGTEKQIEVVLSDPDGRELSRLSAKATLPVPATPGDLRPLMILDFRDLTFDKAGGYSFTTIIDGERQSPSTDFAVALIPRLEERP